MHYTLTEEEKAFIQYWETEGIKQKKWTYMLKRHLPKGLIFSIPIALFFFIMGPKRRAIVSHSELIIIMICIFFIALFYALFKGYVKADRLETHYQILKMKESEQEPTPSDTSDRPT